MWFRNIHYYNSLENELILAVPSFFYRDQVNQRYLKLIHDTLYDLSGMSLKISFEVVKMVLPRENEPEGAQSEGPQPEASGQSSGNQKASNQDSTVSGDIYETEGAAPHIIADPTGTVPQENPASRILSTGNIQHAVAVNSIKKHPDLNVEYTFNHFIVGENNSFAANASIAIAKNPGTAYNPCLIYGGVGLGKTHLIQSIGNYIYTENQKSRVVYVTSETFINEFIQSIQQGKNHQFKNRYRNVDVLLIDDIHFLQGKNQTQEELFHTFNALYESNKQMVFTCDRPVSELKHLTDRLRSRFERGLNVDLQPPNFETRYAILKRKVEDKRAPIDDQVIELISKNITTNVRDLESALTKLIAYSDILSKKITVDIAQEQLKDVFSNPKQSNITIEIIQRAVAEYFNLSPFDLRGKKRTKAIAFPRQIAMYITRTITEYSTTEVGLEFGGRDHTTVMHACQRIESRMKADPYLEPTIQRLMRRIKEYGTKS
jgi:chromosomal replication initiator protein